MKIKHTAMAVLLVATSLSASADMVQAEPGSQMDVTEFRAGKSRPDYEAWIKANESTSARELLEKPPFAPIDINLFTPQVYGGIATPPAPEYIVDEIQLHQLVADTLARRFPGKKGESVIDKALALMDDPTVKAKIPAIQLRAALVMLIGTPLEGTVGAIVSGVQPGSNLPIFFGLVFDQLFGGGNSSGQTVHLDNGQGKIIINEKYQFEDPRFLAALIGHEGLHQDESISNKEEVFCNAFEALTTAQFILEDPTLPQQGTEFIRMQNTEVMALLNTRTADGKINLTMAQGNVFPEGLLPLANFAAIYTPFGQNTPGSAALLSAIRKVTGKHVKKADFDDTTLNLLDQNINLFKPEDWIKVAEALLLDTGDR